MRIAIVTDLFLEVSGGIPAVVRAQREEFLRQGHEVVVFCPGMKMEAGKLSELPGGGAGIELVPTWRWRVLGVPVAKSVRQVRKWLRDWRSEEGWGLAECDVVHVHYELSCSIAGMLMARELGVPLVVTMHGREDVGLEMNVPWGLRNLTMMILNLLHRRWIRHEVGWRKIWGAEESVASGVLGVSGFFGAGRNGGDAGGLMRKLAFSRSEGLALMSSRVGEVEQVKRLAPSRARAKMWELMVAHANFADIVTTPSEHFARKLRVMGVHREVVATPGGVDEAILREEFAVRKWDGRSPLRLIWNSRVSKEKRLSAVLMALWAVQKGVIDGVDSGKCSANNVATDEIDDDRECERRADVGGVDAEQRENVMIAAREERGAERAPVQLVVFGSGNELIKCQGMVRKLGILGVEFRGARDRAEIFAEMRKCHLGVMASVGFDTQGMTLVEAEATGLPVLYCDPDMQEVVPEGGGILVGVRGMAEAIEMIRRRPEKIEEMSRVMLAQRREVGAGVRAERVLEVYRRVVKRLQKP